MCRDNYFDYLRWMNDDNMRPESECMDPYFVSALQSYFEESNF